MRLGARQWCAVSLVLVLCGVLPFAGARLSARAMPGGSKVILFADDETGREALLSRDARLIADYGAFSLWTVEGSSVSALGMASDGISVHPEFDRLLLRETTLDTQVMLPDLEAQAGSGPQLYMVQFVGPIRDEWRADLEATGARIVAYVPYNGYLVWTEEDARVQLARHVAERVEYQWHGPYRPAYRLAGALMGLPGDEGVDVVVQVLSHADSDRTVDEILDQAEAVLLEPHRVLEAINLTVRVPAALLPALAARADVLNIEPWAPPALLDERQGQIMAGQLNAGGTQPVLGQGYLAWLSGLGFPQNPDVYPIVDVIDDGFDNGSAVSPYHPDFRRFGSYVWPSRMAYVRDVTSDGDPHSLGGHGSLNVSIVGGYNNNNGASLYEDSGGYQYGLGISPYGRMASTKVFNDYGDWGYGGSYADLIAGSYSSGARITNNSWGTRYSQPYYTAESQAFDVLTRDAAPTIPGNQEMIHVFSAGNYSTTLTSPGTAKNVITVGASENYRPTGLDGCGVSGSGADNVQDIADFSSRGPTADGRVKPDIVAPGTHIQGAASQDPVYYGWPASYLGVCDRYWPSGQDLYTWSSGTSHAAPAVAGALSLIHTYLTQGMGGTGTGSPSPAMLKAYLLNSTRHIGGVGTGGVYATLPSNAQGWGRADLSRAFDSVPRLLFDQSVLLDHSGQAWELAGVIADSSKPFRVTLAWTDAPGTPSAAAWVNDLNLQVIVGGQTYKGNVFAGATSVSGGSYDSRNNVESVYLPAGLSGPFTVRVTAFDIAGNGVPENGDRTDQDFALVAYNAALERDFEMASSPTLAQVCRASSITYTISVNALYGYDHLVSLTRSAGPPNAVVALKPGSGIPSFTAALQVTTIASTPPGRYAIVVTGTEVTRERTTTAVLDVDTVAPTGAVSLISPTDGITSVVPRPTFTWSAVPNVRTYKVQVSGDASFASLVLDDRVEGTAYQPDVALLDDWMYHWRVVAWNGCGSITSTTRVFTTANPVDVFYDAMESGGSRWTAETVQGTARWILSDRRAHSPSHAWHMPSAAVSTDARLTLAGPIAVDRTTTLAFWHRYDMETAWDGGVIEISANGGAWQDLGGRIIAGGYDYTLSSAQGNPLGGRRAWSGNSDGWREVVVDLSTYAGSSARIRFRWGGDRDNAREPDGWYVDDVRFTQIWPPSRYKAFLPLSFRSG